MSLDRQDIPLRTLILPVYNAETFLAGVLESAFQWLDARSESWELIVVDDASTDGTAVLIDTFMRAHPCASLRLVRFGENRGKGFAVRAGLGLARGDYTIFTDCDLAYPLENIDRILQALDKGADAAVACRVLPQSSYLISPKFFSYLYTRHVMGRVFNALCRILTVPRLRDTQAGLKGLRTQVVRPLVPALVVDGFSFDVELLRALMDRGARIVEVPVAFRYDSEPSTVRFMIDVVVMLRDLIRVRERSLRGLYREAGRTGRITRLIVHADDFGLAPGVDSVIQDNLRSGAVTSTSLLLGAPHSRKALRWAAKHPRYDYGVHLNLTHGRPVLPPSAVPSLVTRTGEFAPLSALLFRYLTRRLRLEEVRAELTAQIEAVRSAGVSLSHLNSHQHVHLLPRLFAGVMVPLARQENLALRMMDGPVRSRMWWFDPKGLLLRLVSVRCRRGGTGPGIAARGTGTALMKNPTLPVARTILSRMQPGRVYELVVHPGTVDDALLSSGDTYTRGREGERTLIGSDEFRALIKIAGLHVTNFHEGLTTTAAP